MLQIQSSLARRVTLIDAMTAFNFALIVIRDEQAVAAIEETLLQLREFYSNVGRTPCNQVIQ